MMWPGVLALAIAALSFVLGDVGWQTLLSAALEIGAVVALFALVCAAEAWN